MGYLWCRILEYFLVNFDGIFLNKFKLGRNNIK